MTTLHRSNDPLLQPFKLKHLTLKNRIFSTSHEPNYAEDGMPTETYRLYHVEKAKGGVSMTMTAGSAIVSADSPPAFGNLHAYKDEIVPWMKRIADECHEFDCKVMIQLTHLGRRTNWNKADWLPVISASQVREAAHRAFPKDMEDWDLKRVVRDYAAAAARMKAAGLDGLELECQGHLLGGFWSPATNKRTDDYGGSLDNRLRLTFEVYEAIREAVGPDFIVGSRMMADESLEGGLSKEEGLEIARRLKASGLVDYLNINRGHIEHDAPLADMIPVLGMRSAPHLDLASDVRTHVKFPVFHAARINDVATARHAVAEGKLDMVGMTRAQIADPHLVRKIMEGREAEIRPCVGATYCLDRIYEGHGALCIHNPSTGREATLPQLVSKAKKAKHIAIIGAGPAGLEAARVAGEAGHKVTLLEASGQAGGQIQVATKIKRRAELIGIVDWRLSELARLGIEIRYNTYAEAEDVRALGADVVLVATGGVPQNLAFSEGAELAVSSWEILAGDVKPAEEVLVYDDNGQHPGMAAAEFVVNAGASLELVSPERFFAPDMGGLNVVPYMRLFGKKGVQITMMTQVKSLARQGNKIKAVLWSPYTDAQVGERLVDQVVVENGTAPVDDLYFALKEDSVNRGEIDYAALIASGPQKIAVNKDGAFQLFRIGDAVASRNIHAAIYDASRLVRAL